MQIHFVLYYYPGCAGALLLHMVIYYTGDNTGVINFSNWVMFTYFPILPMMLSDYRSY